VTRLIEHYGLAFLFLNVLIEVVGVPLPGEASLIAAGVLASRGKLDIAAVVLVAAVAASVGGPLGYRIGTVGGRRLERWRPLQRAIGPSERFFDRHGGKTVLVARFVPILRFTAPWMAGVGRMPFGRFLVWNTIGSVAWALVIGLVAYALGDAAATAITRFGAYGVAGAVVVAALGFALLHVYRRRLFRPRGDEA
jgi:membrane-associated protein